MGTLLRVNLTDGSIRTESLAETLQARFVGGRGLATKLLWDAGAASVDPLSPANPLLFATGPLTGTHAPTGGRYVVVTKSPLTGAVACSNSGGYWGPALHYAGYDVLMVEGAAARSVYLWIHDDGVEIRGAEHVWGKTVSETEEILQAETHPDARVAAIGPAGEEQALVACVMNDRGRAAGRSGVGAVMGAKRLKAVVVYGTRGLGVARPEAFGRATRAAVDEVAASPLSEGLRLLGTASTVGFMNRVGILPTRNFREGTFEYAEAVCGERLRETYLVRNRGCHSCVIHCGRVTKLAGPRWEGHGEGPEYETIFGLGTDCGVGDLAAITYANYLCNELGMDTIEAGAAVATAMELAESGLLPEEEVGFRLRFGDGEAMVRSIEAMGRGRDFGKVLGLGGYRVAARYGHPELFMGSKKQAFAAYDPRGAVGMGLGYATSNRGACHLRGYSISLEYFGNPVKLDPFSTEGKAEWMVLLQNSTAFVDSSGLCLFATMALSADALAALVAEATGRDLDPDEVQRIGERIWNLERLFNNAAGLGRADDTLPPRMLREPLRRGMAKGHVVPLDRLLDEYYRCRGWDPDGRPSAEKLAELGLA